MRQSYFRLQAVSEMEYRPLADDIRPQTLDEVVGQSHILGEHGMLRRIIESGNIPNMVFYGPSGTGKTTVANIIWMRSNTLIKSSSSLCWSLWRTARSR